ncbi:MAG: hypothetical protein ACLFT0_06870 [Spirulinaceae cyanobacterium]
MTLVQAVVVRSEITTRDRVLSMKNADIADTQAVSPSKQASLKTQDWHNRKKAFV